MASRSNPETDDAQACLRIAPPPAAARLCQTPQRSPRKSQGGLAAWQERKATELIEASLDRDIAVETIALECGLSVGHFARCFKKTLGMPPHQWRLGRRVEKAKGMLEQGDVPVSHIAAACGFSDQSHLSRVFRKFTGMPPLAWRHVHVCPPCAAPSQNRSSQNRSGSHALSISL